jgi:L-rhamnose mutarotase
MEKIAFSMQLKHGRAAEYQRRHEEIWPELVALLKESGISDYSIFLEEETGRLFAVLTRSADHKMDGLPDAEVMRRWWSYMAEIMLANPDQSPTVVPLRQVFYLP